MPTAISYPPELPVSQRRDEILAALRAHPVVIVAGETGSGKTTQLPKMCLEAGLARRGTIGCTQPRRVAAMSISRRVTEELAPLGFTWGREIGCKMRFNDDTSRQTQVKFMTDGILLAEIQSDPLLRAYSTLIIDEAHERSLNIDFLLGYLQGLLTKRSDLKVIITSATIDTAAFSEAFGGAPVIEVSGRLYPVEIRYAPLEDAEEEMHYVEAAVKATEDALIGTDHGDTLVFMPTERDIRETRELMESTLGESAEVLALFGRMPTAEQQRIFSPGPKRRVIIATNVAETSLTLPRITTVIDTGLARISRYTPRTRTKRLPVEPVAQSSANQRAGRAGRLSDGLCIRLYSEEDLGKRPLFTQPEIQRANLAEVILRMKAFRLGEVENFPFLNPPLPQSIRAGYQLLEELGALTQAESEYRLTPLGRELARLPVDPTLGRMLLQARSEGVLPEVLAIAAGLSIPDPRERPDEQKEAAAAAHRAFAHPESDFLSLLNLWNAAPSPEGGAVRTSRNALRRFCKANFLSLTRMREWRDIYRQLEEAMRGPSRSQPGRAPKDAEALYTAVHRSILAGLLGQVAQRKERNQYTATGNRAVVLFPGSGLFERQQKRRKVGETALKQPEWIMAGEVVQTSQLFARTVARVDPAWIVELGVHLCRFRHTEPHWSLKAGRVLVRERALLHGLEITSRMIDYGRVNPGEATELFIRGALIGDGEAPLPKITHRFFKENQRLRGEVETALTKLRSHRVHELDEALFRFYRERLEPGISSVHDLDRWVRARIGREPRLLCATEADLLPGGAECDRDAFPDSAPIGNAVLPLAYRYAPGEENDGVTLRVPLPLADQLSSGQLLWMVPGLRQEQIAALFQQLPKPRRRELMPLEPKISETAREFSPDDGDFYEALSRFVAVKWRVTISREEWKSLPDYLIPRVEVVDRHQKTVAAGRDPEALREAAAKRGTQGDSWERVAKRWERQGITTWDLGDLPESVKVETIGGVPLLAYPGLQCEKEGTVSLRVFRTREEAEAASVGGVRRLGELAMEKELARFAKEFEAACRQAPAKAVTAKKQPQGFASLGDMLGNIALPAKQAAPAVPSFRKGMAPAPSPAPATPLQPLGEAARRYAARELLSPTPALPLREARFAALCTKMERDWPALLARTAPVVAPLLTLKEELLSRPKRPASLEEDLARLLPPDFLISTPADQLRHLPRYLKAAQTRAERAALNPVKDREKAAQLAPFTDWRKRVPAERQEEFRWMLEEFRVSLFAQELGTAHPISARRLEALMKG